MNTLEKRIFSVEHKRKLSLSHKKPRPYRIGRPLLKNMAKGNPNWKGGKIEIECKECKQKYFVFLCRKNKSLYCSLLCQNNYKKGKKVEHLIKVRHLMKGTNHPLFGKNLPDWWRKKISDNHADVSGEKSGTWRGGITSINERIRKTKEYMLWRTAVFSRDVYTCNKCNKKGGKLNADHIKPFSLYPELRFAIDNGQTLCYECHRQKTSDDMIIIRKEAPHIWLYQN